MRHSSSDKCSRAMIPQEDEGDWSLRANSDTYLDRFGESKILTERLTRSTASVIGIAGQRGAGKSSLAMLVLERCRKRNFYAQLIHSPIGYNPHEFLLCVFQSVCDEVVAQIDRQFGQADSLEAHAKAHRRRIRGYTVSLVVIVVTLLCTALAFAHYEDLRRQQVGTLSELRGELRSLTALETELFSTYSASLAQGNTSLGGVPPSPLQMQLDGVLRDRAMKDESVADIENQLSSRHQLFLMSPALLLLIPLYFALGYFSTLVRQASYARRFSEQAGLRHLAIEFSENLRYQTSTSKTTQATVSFWQLTGGVREKRTAIARPQSLPSLTAEFSQFLERVAEVYRNRVVICLDELDKIDNPKDFESLLRGIKGVLGQPHTHFILTVSEDALAEFTTRRRMTRGMLESAFEDIMVLEHIDLRICEHMLDLMYSEAERRREGEELHDSTTVLWLFGSAMPREIKRHALVCLESNLSPKSSRRGDVWKCVYRFRLKEMMSWAARVGEEEANGAVFLSCLRDNIAYMDRHFGQRVAEGEYSLQSIMDLLQPWSKHFPELFYDEHGEARAAWVTEVGTGDDGEAPASSVSFSRAAIDVVVAASALANATDGNTMKLSGPAVERLQTMFQFLPRNVEFSSELLREHLRESGVWKG